MVVSWRQSLLADSLFGFLFSLRCAMIFLVLTALSIITRYYFLRYMLLLYCRSGTILYILIFWLVEVWIRKFVYGMLTRPTVLDHKTSVNNSQHISYILFAGNLETAVTFSHSFADRPIASIAFHAKGEILAVASGHKVRPTVLNLNNRKKEKTMFSALVLLPLVLY
jgi:hypothetical protein